MILCLALSSFKTFLIESIVGLPRASVWLFGIAWTMEYHMLTSSHLGQGQTYKQAQYQKDTHPKNGHLAVFPLRPTVP